MFRNVLMGFAVLVVVVAIGLGGGYLYLRTSLPQTGGTVTLAGLDRPVKIVRDVNAVPHIFAESPKDAYFALGYVHAQDRLWQMEFMRRLGAGRLAEVLGESAVATDRFMRTLGIYRYAEKISAAASPDVRAALEAYAAGVNAWLTSRSGALPLEFLVLGFEPEPWRAADSTLWGRLMALRLGRNWRTELLRGQIAQTLRAKGLPPERIGELWPDGPPNAPVTLTGVIGGLRPSPDALRDHTEPGLPADSGSNGWVVHGSRTETGKPVLANDPHLRFGAPVVWYLARIEAPGLTVTGVTVPGLPFTLLGHNGSIAWGFTNAGGDVEDLFVETVDPNQPLSYLAPDGPLRFKTRREVILVKGGKTIDLTVRATRHGPVISDISENAAGVAGPGHVVALATPALRADDRTVEALFAINRARNWTDIRNAAAKFHTPQQNIFFAAKDGDTGFISPGRIPRRKAGDGRFPVLGSDGRHDWKDFIPFESIPQAHNPPSGRILNANNRIVSNDYPYLISNDWSQPFRAERIAAVLDGRALHSAAASRSLQLDILSLEAQRLLPMMMRVQPADRRSRQALDLLSKWNFEMRRERSEPLIYTAWLREFAFAVAKDEIGDARLRSYLWLVSSPSPRFVEMVLTRNRHWCDDIGTAAMETCNERLALALGRALDDIGTKLGSDITSWRWGAVHRATFTHRVLTHIPVLASFADLSIGSDGGNHTVNSGTIARKDSANPYGHTDGSGYRAVYDLANLDDSQFMIATGQSGNFLSPRYADFLPRWRDGRYIRIAGSPDALSASAMGELRLLPTTGR